MSRLRAKITLFRTGGRTDGETLGPGSAPPTRAQEEKCTVRYGGVAPSHLTPIYVSGDEIRARRREGPEGIFKVPKVSKKEKWNSKKGPRQAPETLGFVVRCLECWNFPKSISSGQASVSCGIWGTFLAGPQPGREGLVNVVPESVKRSVPVRTRLILKSSKTL